MIENFNLLVSSARGDEQDANFELRYLLRELGDSSATTGFTPVSGLTVARTELDPVRLIWELRSILKVKPWEFRYILKLKPVKEVVQCTLSQIEEAVIRQASVIKEGETFRVSVTKRRSNISSKELIDAVASKIPRKVDLQNPQKMILIEIIHQRAGISVIEPNCILGIEKEKRSPSPEPSAVQTAR